MGQRNLLYLLLLSMALAVAVHADCGSTKRACHILGEEHGVTAFCMYKSDKNKCSGKFHSGKQYCTERKKCGCCVPKNEVMNQCIADGGHNSVLWNKVAEAEKAIIATEIASEAAIIATEIALETAITETVNEGNNNVTRALEMRINKMEKELQDKLDTILHHCCKRIETTTAPSSTTATPLTMGPHTTTVEKTTAPPTTTSTQSSMGPHTTTVDTTMAQRTTTPPTSNTTPTPPPPDCESPWVSIGYSGCFLIEKLGVWMPRENARQYCQNAGGELVNLEVELIRTEVNTYLDNKGRLWESFWVGASSQSGSWVWNNMNAVTDGDLCLYTFNGDLRETHCTNSKNLICEK